MPLNGQTQLVNGIPQPATEQAAEQALLGRPLSAGYRPTLPITQLYGCTGAYLANRILYDIETMLLHPYVALPYSYYKNAIANCEFEIRASSPKVEEFVRQEANHYWSHSLAPSQLCYDYGWAGFEPGYHVKNAYLRQRSLDDFSPLDTHALVHQQRYVGLELRNVEGSTGSLQLWGPGRWPAKGFWLTHKRRFNRWYGRTHLMGCWRPFLRLATRDGAEEVLDGAMYRYAFGGSTAYYPPEEFLKEEGGIDYEAARNGTQQMLEDEKAGMVVALPDVANKDTGLNRWRIERNYQTLDPSGMLERIDALRKEISYGLEVPPEVIEANEVGTGWSGRKVPLVGFFVGQVRNARHLIWAWKWQIGDPLVKWNFGRDAWFEIEVRLTLPPELQGEDKPGSETGKAADGANPLADAMQKAPKPGPQPPPTTFPPQGQKPAGTALATEEEPETAILAVDDILGQVMRAWSKFKAGLKKALFGAVAAGPIEATLPRVRETLELARPKLERLTSAARLAGVLRGMERVAARAEATSPGVLPQLETGAAAVPAPLPSLVLPPTPLDAPHGLPVEHETLPLIEAAAQSLASKRLLTKGDFDQLEAQARQEAFTVAGAETDAVLRKIRDSLIAVIENGETKKQFVERLKTATGEGTILAPNHVEVVFRTNIHAAYSEGQNRLLEQPLVNSLFPYAVYDAIQDDRVRPEHVALETLGIQGTNVYRRDDKVFRIFRPPWSWNCRCSWTPLSIREAARRGIEEAIKWVETGIEPYPPAFVPMPPFQPDPTFDRGDVALSIVEELPLEDAREGLLAKARQALVVTLAALPHSADVARDAVEKAAAALSEYAGADVALSTISPPRTIKGRFSPGVALATHHAPKGGISIGGKDFVGGEFIPADVVKEATKTEKAQLTKVAKGKPPEEQDANKPLEEQDPDANRPSSKENRYADAMPEAKPWQEPPPKKPRPKGEKFTRPVGEESQTRLGDHTEELSKQLGFRNILPAGRRSNKDVKTEGSSIDVEFDHSGRAYELKMCKTTSTEYRLKAKKEEKDAKMEYAKKHDLKVYTMIAVRDADGSTVHFYCSKQPGLTGAEISPKDFDFVGKVTY